MGKRQCAAEGRQRRHDSSAPERTTMIAMDVAASENSAPRDQMASREAGCSVMRCRAIKFVFVVTTRIMALADGTVWADRTIQPIIGSPSPGNDPHMAFNAFHSAPVKSGFGGSSTVTLLMAVIRSLVSGWSRRSATASSLSEAMRDKTAARALASAPTPASLDADPPAAASAWREEDEPSTVWPRSNGAAADKIAEDHAERNVQARALQHGAGAIAMHDTADFMGDDAGELVRGSLFANNPSNT